MSGRSYKLPSLHHYSQMISGSPRREPVRWLLPHATIPLSRAGVSNALDSTGLKARCAAAGFFLGFRKGEVCV
jgi:hypothetical protein